MKNIEVSHSQQSSVSFFNLSNFIVDYHIPKTQSSSICFKDNSHLVNVCDDQFCLLPELYQDKVTYFVIFRSGIYWLKDLQDLKVQLKDQQHLEKLVQHLLEFLTQPKVQLFWQIEVQLERKLVQLVKHTRVQTLKDFLEQEHVQLLVQFLVQPEEQLVDQLKKNLSKQFVVHHMVKQELEQVLQLMLSGAQLVEQLEVELFGQLLQVTFVGELQATWKLSRQSKIKFLNQPKVQVVKLLRVQPLDTLKAKPVKIELLVHLQLAFLQQLKKTFCRQLEQQLLKQFLVQQVLQLILQLVLRVLQPRSYQSEPVKVPNGVCGCTDVMGFCS